jgi:hypothetical protein
MGGGIYCDNSSPTIQKNIITGNYAIFYRGEIPGFGGGIYCYESSAVITGNIITRNSVEGRGGGIFAGESSLILSNNIITDNDAYGYVGVFSTSARGGGISCQESSLKIVNNTISGNHAHDFNEPPWFLPGIGGGIQSGGSSLTIVNTIIWGDTPNEITFYGGIISSYSDIQGGWPGTANIDTDPCFADPCSSDYHLKSQAGRWNPNSQSWVTDVVTSHCIDAGNPGCPLRDEPSDANNVRINMGAYGGTAQASKTPADWRSIADLTNDWVIDFNDLGAFVSFWLDTGECIPSDLNRNQLANFDDYAIFARQWPGAIAEPGIEYQISPCQKGLSATEQMDQTRFTVTVEGRSIHFEDMMSANCCPGTLWLEMDVIGNLITINEHEEIGEYPCPCMCDYPVTATLGPFEPGTYTFEVYQNSSFIGSTTITIE